ncbi:gamma-glutamylcyclotransferase [Teichococcus cervicalis]|uniref:glutathione-specific gamma-glutamylcyclotransferase n=1 Tax=Pseudoroseomonas cervicalis ATCC 49957 TaxID=525371 RepID=D5RN91_9PROT|nr:gamma-glutamylcyclotransferase [Pseudoroseomonas cervicalis]EFH11229.1 ChaC-like protein [Pseudoroseomonas cervicalis ATCC 49957]
MAETPPPPDRRPDPGRQAPADATPEAVPEAVIEAAGQQPAAPAPQAAPMALTRDYLQSGAIDEMARAALGATLLSQEAREASLRATLAARPPEAEAVWLFGYGSLIWNPTIHFAEQRRARIEGWQRHFCLSTPIGRGTPERPGLVLALDRGGACEGVAFRLEEAGLQAELSLVWRREMLSGAYIPLWLPLQAEDGRAFGHGIAFVINPDGPQYADLAEAEIVHRLATASGRLGSCAEYLFNTREGLRRLGIADPMLERLAGAVTAAQAARPGG